MATTAGAQDAASTRSVTYAGVSVSVPSSWPVLNVAGRVSCVRYDRHAVYLGTPSSSDCPSHLTEHLTTVQIAPSGTTAATSTRELPGGGVRVSGGSEVAPDLIVTAEDSSTQVTVTSGDPSAGKIADSVRFSSAAPAAAVMPVPPSGRSGTRTAVGSALQAASVAPVATYSGPGFDTCEAPSLSRMRAWTASPYRAIGVYIGGASRSCAQPNLTATWVSEVHDLGWHLTPLYVGLQAPCTDFSNRIDPARAAWQGTQAADEAVSQMSALGLDAGNPIYFDMEAYDTGNTSCVAAVKKFVDAWTVELHAKQYVSGIYGSAGSMMKNLVQFVSDPAFHGPDDVWYSHWDGHASTVDDPFIPNTKWTGHHRIHQYRGPHDETFGGFKINIDSNQLDGATSRPSVAAAPAGVAGAFEPVDPYRVLDTRNGIGGTQAAVAARGTVALTVTGTGGSHGVPATGVAAVVINVTVTAPTATAGSITVFPDGPDRPNVSNLNFVKGQTVPNLVVTQVAGNGKIALYNGSTGSVQLIADITGYYLNGTASAPGAFVPLTPYRALDTRDGTGGTNGPVLAHGSVTLTATGTSGGVPDGVSAVVVNVTVTGPEAKGSITVYPDRDNPPNVSNLNFVAGQTVANLVVVKVSSDGKIMLYNGSEGSAQLIADITGYYLAGTPTERGTFVPLTPKRALDTRYGTGGTNGPVLANGSVILTATGSAGVPITGVAAIVVNVTAASPSAAGSITVHPDGSPTPYSSNLNFTAGQTVPNLVIGSLPDSGKIDLYNGSAGTVQLIGDVSGYFLTGAG